MTSLTVASMLWAATAAQALRVDAPLVEEMPRIDGLLDEELWSDAAVVTGFVQSEPRFGEPAQETTEVRIAYTKTHLLVGAILRDSEPDRIVATEYRRDAFLDAEDSFEIYLDTFRDGRNAFYFATNAVGSRLDGLVRNEGADLNYEWDGVWDVAARRNREGWIAEVAIPFDTLRFVPGSERGWGLNFGRRVARSREEAYWAPISPDWGFNAKFRISAFGELQGMEEAEPGGRLKLKPYGLGSAERDFVDSLGADAGFTAGLDAKVGLSSTLNLDLTINTDFAQVESDQEQVNLTRFPLFFPEKREFFLENAGLFRIGETTRPFEPAGTLLLFSRQIGLSEDGEEIPIFGGARLTGRLKDTELGAFFIRTERTALEDETIPDTSFAAVRVKQNIFARSSIGGMFLSKSPAMEASSNRVAAMDFNVPFSRNATVNGFVAKSRTPGLEGSDHAAALHGEWVTDRASVYGDFADIGDDFESEMGFVPRSGIRKYKGQAFWSPRPDVLGIRQLYLGNDHSYIADREGDLQSQYNSLGPFVVFDNGSFLFGEWLYSAEGLKEPFEIHDDVEIPTGEYRFHRLNVGFNGDQSRRLALNFFYSAGAFYNGTLRSFGLGLNTKPHSRLLLNLNFNRNDVDLPTDGGTFTTNLLIARAILAFSPQAFVRALVQYNDDAEEILANVLFRYTYRPGSDLFVVYNEERDAGARATPRKRELIVKLTFYGVPF